MKKYSFLEVDFPAAVAWIAAGTSKN